MSIAPLTEAHGALPRPGGAGARRAAGPGVRAQLARLVRLVRLLQTERFLNARELAERCEVSRRTVYRDLETLAEAGISVGFRPDRQGYQLARGFSLPPTGLDETEALALLALARQGPAGDGFGLRRRARQGAVDLVQGLTSEARERVLTAAEPFQDRPAPDGLPAERRAVHDAILASLGRRRQLRLWYRDPASLAEECTKFSLYRLVSHGPHWFLVGRSSLHRRVEVIGLPWVGKVVLTDDPYTIPPRFDLERFLGRAWGVERSRFRRHVRLRFSPRAAPEVEDVVWHRSQRRVTLDGGGVELHFVVDGVEEVLRWVLGFGDQVEVLAPPELRERLHEVAARMASRHRGPAAPA